MGRADEHPVTFPYGAVDGYYYGPRGVVGPSHQADDRAMPVGEEVWVGLTLIGLSGNTGLSGGAHLHGQAGTDAWCQNTVNPKNYWWKGDEVVHVGVGDQWGNFVIIKYTNIFRLTRYMCYAHLSEVFVQPGGKITKENEMYKNKSAKHWYEQFVVFKGERNYFKDKYTAELAKSQAYLSERQYFKSGFNEQQEIIKEIEAASLAATNGLKSDLETANAEVIRLTQKLAEVAADVREAEQAADTAVDGFITRVLASIGEWLKGLR